jgi:hypothetical protein
MNRQTWTNEKISKYSRVGRTGGQEEPTCSLCGRRENSMHLMFECEKCSEPLWKKNKKKSKMKW